MAFYFGKLLALLSDMFIQVFISPWQIFQTIAFTNPTTSNIHRRYNKRKSIVRIIGTYLPLPSAPKVYLNLAAWNSCANSYTSVVNFSDEFLDKDEFEFSERSAHSERCNSEAAIKSLQQELHELRLQIAALLENQSNVVKGVDKGANSFNNGGSRSNGQISVPPPPPPPLPPVPPPLPPPLPPAAVQIRPKPLMKKDPRCNSYNNAATPNALQILGQVLSEMKNGRPKLKPIERSPGGTPLKLNRKLKTDPSDVLTEVLKRRFSVAQMSDTNESDSSIQTDIASSPDWTTYVT